MHGDGGQVLVDYITIAGAKKSKMRSHVGADDCVRNGPLERRPIVQTRQHSLSHRPRSFLMTALSFLLVCLLVLDIGQGVQAQQQDPLTMYGGSVLAMAGKDCVVLAVDKRFGFGNSMIHITPRPVLHLPDQVMVAFTGLQGDVQSLKSELATQVAAKYSRGLGFGGAVQSSSTAKRRRTITPTSMASLTSHVLYQKRTSGAYFVEPLIIGLEPDGWIDLGETVSEKADDAATSDLAAAPPTTHQQMHQKRIRYRPYLCR